jgi:hypothetical protein
MATAMTAKMVSCKTDACATSTLFLLNCRCISHNVCLAQNIYIYIYIYICFFFCHADPTHVVSPTRLHFGASTTVEPYQGKASVQPCQSQLCVTSHKANRPKGCDHNTQGQRCLQLFGVGRPGSERMSTRQPQSTPRENCINPDCGNAKDGTRRSPTTKPTTT